MKVPVSHMHPGLRACVENTHNGTQKALTRQEKRKHLFCQGYKNILMCIGDCWKSLVLKKIIQKINKHWRTNCRECWNKGLIKTPAVEKEKEKKDSYTWALCQIKHVHRRTINNVIFGWWNEIEAKIGDWFLYFTELLTDCKQGLFVS